MGHLHQEVLECPRCESTNTKFCYYNNYNKSQPRHFCRACKRHWTKGGTLRNVPVGGARKNKRLKPSTGGTTTATTTAAAKNKINSSRIGSYSQGRSRDIFQEHSDQYTCQTVIGPPSSLQYQNDKNTLERNFICNNGFFMDSTLEVSQDQGLQSSHSNLSSFETNPFPISASFLSPNAYDFTGKLQTGEDPTTAAAAATTTTNAAIFQPWQVPTTSNNVMEMANYWNWSDIDTLVSADLNIPWDDTEIKP